MNSSRVQKMADVLKSPLWKMSITVFAASLLMMNVLITNTFSKPGADESRMLLKQGNQRFVAGTLKHPNTTKARVAQSGKESQADHAYATVISCSDSRVPVEHIFDAGIMDIFIIRVAGNVCATDEIGSAEYGIAHVKTPVLVVLGHSQCGAVTAVTHAIHGQGHALERNMRYQQPERRAVTGHIDKVNTAVAQMDKVTQQNAANSEESASASEELSSQAQNLNAMVAQLSAVIGGSNRDDGTGI